MGARRQQRSPFGLSLLDLLCCAFGATILLIVLTQRQADSELAQAQNRRNIAEATATAAREDKRISSDRASRVRSLASMSGSRPSSLSRLPFLPEVAASKIVVVLDTSGSMRAFDRARMGTSDASKWRQAETVILQLLLQQPNLTRFAVVALDDGRRASPGSRRIFPASEPWATGEGDPGLNAISAAAQALRTTMPAGGSDHAHTLSHVIEEYVAKAREPADAIVLITDGLPNVQAGSVPAAAVDVSPERKRALATQALERIAATLAQLPAPRRASLRLHVVCLEWPDDAELPAFGLSLASLGNGYCVYLSPEELPGG